ncbi:Protein kinase-like domain [Pseudocohnilembus persalinus]|uniref:Protein kinase-like domain n=1 Tax=Pseudocohnilembus persalinus TaxID=266149 RepID=A0A0V0QTS8_PSEPJ|nr:Protein kinase-like domain [Pseudocohnilembus persalinus]|eukprot:KRX05801.1 Protein kinase-like domain [Pseudocohnilembus persalinus]
MKLFYPKFYNQKQITSYQQQILEQEKQLVKREFQRFIDINLFIFSFIGGFTGSQVGIRMLYKRYSAITEFYKYAQQLVNGVEQISLQGVYHLDLKMQNVRLDKEEKLKIIDFGISNSNQDQYLKGYTYNISAPEYNQNGAINKTSDIWSLGCLLYFMIFKNNPFQEIYFDGDLIEYGKKQIEALNQGHIQYNQNKIQLSGLEGEGEQHLPAIYIPYLDKDDFTSPYLLIYFHANAEDIGSSYDSLLFDLRSKLKINILSFEYPGYGLYKDNQKELRPNEKQIEIDSQNIYKYAVNVLKFPEKNIILLGRSIGGGPMAHLAGKYRPKAVIFFMCFQSLRKVAQDYTSKILSKAVPDYFKNIDLIKKMQSAILIIHGENDELIKISHAKNMWKEVEKLPIIDGKVHQKYFSKTMTHTIFNLDDDLIEPVQIFFSKNKIDPFCQQNKVDFIRSELFQNVLYQDLAKEIDEQPDEEQEEDRLQTEIIEKEEILLLKQEQKKQKKIEITNQKLTVINNEQQKLFDSTKADQQNEDENLSLQFEDFQFSEKKNYINIKKIDDHFTQSKGPQKKSIKNQEISDIKLDQDQVILQHISKNSQHKRSLIQQQIQKKSFQAQSSELEDQKELEQQQALFIEQQMEKTFDDMKINNDKQQQYNNNFYHDLNTQQKHCINIQKQNTCYDKKQNQQHDEQKNNDIGVKNQSFHRNYNPNAIFGNQN